MKIIPKSEAPHANRYWRRRMAAEMRAQATKQRHTLRVFSARLERNVVSAEKRAKRMEKE